MLTRLPALFPPLLLMAAALCPAQAQPEPLTAREGGMATGGIEAALLFPAAPGHPAPLSLLDAGNAVALGMPD